MLYFAYGSNMSQQRIKRRVPRTQFVGVAALSNFQLRFHKKGRDGSAKADALFTGNPDDRVFGALYQLSENELLLLDKIEDCGIGYERKEVMVDAEGKWYPAWVYCALHIDRSLKPYSWYHQHVIVGAEQLSLPLEYIQHIKGFSCCEDYDLERATREISIY